MSQTGSCATTAFRLFSLRSLPTNPVTASYDLPYKPTLPVDQDRPAAHLMAARTSACSPGPTQSRHPVLPPKPRRSTITKV
jgi:hypothetical protein